MTITVHNPEVWVDKKGVVYVRCDAPGQRAVSQEVVDLETFIVALAKAFGDSVTVTPTRDSVSFIQGLADQAGYSAVLTPKALSTDPA